MKGKFWRTICSRTINILSYDNIAKISLDFQKIITDYSTKKQNSSKWKTERLGLDNTKVADLSISITFPFIFSKKVLGKITTILWRVLVLVKLRFSM